VSGGHVEERALVAAGELDAYGIDFLNDPQEGGRAGLGPAGPKPPPPWRGGSSSGVKKKIGAGGAEEKGLPKKTQR